MNARQGLSAPHLNVPSLNVVVPYSASNSTVRVRALHWLDRLGWQNTAHVYGPGFLSGGPSGGGEVLLLRNIRRISTGRAEEVLLRRAHLGVYDLDDGLPWDDGNLLGHAALWKRVIPISRVARRAANAADRVIAGNSVLADWATEWCEDVRVIPTCVEPADYRPRATWDIGSTPVIGWIGSPATELYVREIASALAAVVERTGARLEMVSGPGTTPPELARFTTRIAWSPSAEERVGTWDVGIMPLADGIYERAKCGYKLLQYAASGVPAVGSPVGVNATILSQMDGLAPTSIDEWVDALTTVLMEPSTRREQRARAGLAVADEYSYGHWQDRWLDAVVV